MFVVDPRREPVDSCQETRIGFSVPRFARVYLEIIKKRSTSSASIHVCRAGRVLSLPSRFRGCFRCELQRHRTTTYTVGVAVLLCCPEESFSPLTACYAFNARCEGREKEEEGFWKKEGRKTPTSRTVFLCEIGEHVDCRHEYSYVRVQRTSFQGKIQIFFFTSFYAPSLIQVQSIEIAPNFCELFQNYINV